MGLRSPSPKLVRILLFSALALFTFSITFNAWLCDDAFITFRVMDNFVHGYGLRWNVAERVQAFTNPLWLIALAPVYWATHEIYFTSILFSILISVGAVAILAFGIARNASAGMLAVIILASSKAFVEFSTSGMENPLTHLLMAFFAVAYFKEEFTSKRIVLLALFAAFAAVNRLDSILPFLPPLAYALWRASDRGKGIVQLSAGFLPLIAWELFSVIYYGFAFPNTAYAKLMNGLPETELIRQGLFYFWNSLRNDPLTPVCVVLGVISGFRSAEWRVRMLAVGILLNLIYVLMVGGDFMSGRFLTPALFCASIVLGRETHLLPVSVASLAAAAILLFACLFPASPLRNRPSYDEGITRFVDSAGISDERAFHYRYTGLFASHRDLGVQLHPWAAYGMQARDSGIPLVMDTRVGMGLFGFYAGPGVHIVDSLALSDPLLARLPRVDSDPRDVLPNQIHPTWRIGHIRRAIPEGYEDTLRTGENHLADPEIALLYDRLEIVTRGAIFSKQRGREIWRFRGGL